MRCRRCALGLQAKHSTFGIAVTMSPSPPSLQTPLWNTSPCFFRPRPVRDVCHLVFRLAIL